MTVQVLASTLVSGLLLGSLYALMASGLGLIWTTLGVFNFSHGALMMVAAFVAWTVSEPLGLGVWVGGISGVFAAAVIALLIEWLLVRPFYGQRNMLLITVMTTLAAMIILEQGAQLVWGARLKQLPPLISGQLSLGGVTISTHEAAIIIIAPLILLALANYTRHTSSGRSLRAVGQNLDAASLIGINVPRAFALTFFLSGLLAGLAGVLLGSIRFITPALGTEPIVKAMIVVIFGGLGSLKSTAGAAYVVGLIEAFLVLAIGLYWTPFALFSLMIVVLLVRPNGLFGRI